MKAKVEEVGIFNRYIGNGQHEKMLTVKFTPEVGLGVAVLYYPWDMAPLFPLGKEVNIDVTEVK